MKSRGDRKVADRFYMSPEWLEARQMSIALHAYACAECGRRGCRLYVDHVVEIRDGGAPLAQANLRPLCGSCHVKKTVRERDRRLTGGK